MPRWAWPVRALALALTLAGLYPWTAHAQEGFYLTPSLSIAEVYDDNLFSTPSGRKADLISRFSPGIQAGYQSVPFTLVGRYTFDAEVFAANPDLTTAQARQEASLRLQHRPTRPLTLALDTLYVETETPGELNVETGLVTGRVRAQRLTVRPSLAYQLDPLTTTALDATFAEDESFGGVKTRTYTATLGLDRRLSRLDTGSLGYTFRHFAFDGTDTTTSHALTLGWSRDITRLTSLALRAGPRISEGSPGVEVLASLRHRLRPGELSLTYSRSQTTAIGEAGAVTTESLTGGVTYQFLPGFEVRAAPGVFQSQSAGFDARIYTLSVDATYRISRWLAIGAAYAFTLQQASLDSVRPRDEEIARNVLMLRLVLIQPYRVY